MSAIFSFQTAFLVVLILAVAGYFRGRSRAVASVDGQTQLLHSRPIHHGWHVVLAAIIPSLSLLILWVFLQSLFTNSLVSATIPDDIADIQVPLEQRQGLTEEQLQIRENALRDLFFGNVKTLAAAVEGYVSGGAATEEQVDSWRADLAPLRERLRADGQVVSAEVTQPMLVQALRLRDVQNTLSALGPAIGMALALIGAVIAYLIIKPEFRARNAVERWVMGLLIFASFMAILTTIGILGAVTVPTLTFFSEYGFFSFLFGFEWAPSGDVVGDPRGPDGTYQTQLGFLPLIWGTLYIAFVALLVATPLGLLAAVYLSEFAGKRFRAWAKPALEVLAGVPTIVYGLFALVTIGPFLQAVVGATIMPNTVSVMTAGVVMGMMLVPFVSSLSDDVINAVPQAMRDGSLGLGATKSETVTRVILPAALPGIVGAIVLAASRAIGETMIVVLAAGALSNVVGLEPNPFGAVVTVTTRIVAVLTGEASGFDSIDVLAVFALAFTLFFITLGLNLLAQRIVRKYREQYD